MRKNRQQKTKGKEKASRAQTRLKEHRMQKKVLVPPLADLPNLMPTSWSDERLPEMLWAAMLVTTFERKDALERIQKTLVQLREILVEGVIPKPPGPEPWAITMSGLARLPERDREQVITVIAADEQAKNCLRPMLLLDNLPAKRTWEQGIGKQPDQESGWPALAVAIEKCFYHESQEATDCRWAKVIFGMITGRIRFSAELKETVELLRLYPTLNEQDLRKARPSARAMEVAFGGQECSVWSHNFWTECRDKTACFQQALTEAEQESLIPSEEQIRTWKTYSRELSEKVLTQFWHEAPPMEEEARHQIAFGLVIYCVDLVTISLALGLGRTPQARLTLRAMAECLITLKFLVDKDDPSLWAAFRQHGEGQAKLVCQRCEEEGRIPPYIDHEKLGQIANDTTWVEFLSVKIGNWEGGDLRKMATESGLKEIYDDYYTWTSNYTHGLWGAIRESAFSHCHNPLHRFHRIPILHALNLNDATGDMQNLMSLVLEQFYRIYPPE